MRRDSVRAIERSNDRPIERSSDRPIERSRIELTHCHARDAFTHPADYIADDVDDVNVVDADVVDAAVVVASCC